MSSEFEVILTLTASPPNIDADELEQHMYDVEEAVATHVPEADGPVVSVEFSRCEIELAFSVVTASPTAVQKVVFAAMEAIEQHTELEFQNFGTSAKEPEGKARAVALC